jgi:hypothetical protein
MFPKERPEFHCPVCAYARLPDPEPDNDLRIECPSCGTQLVYDFKYFWGYQLLCVVAAVLVAFEQRLEGPIFVLGALFYYAVLFFGVSRFILPLLPLYVKVYGPRFTTLQINKK